MKLIKDLGMRYNRFGNKYRYGLYLCENCNTEFKLATHNVKRQKTNVCFSCGLIARNTKHGLAKRKSYQVHSNMMARCYNKNSKQYKDWGGRGIKVCLQWHNIAIFNEWFIKNYKDGLQIDRIDNDGNYEPSNCRFLSSSDNIKNNKNGLDIQSKEPYVLWDKRLKKWKVSIPPSKKRYQVKRVYLGLFNDEKDAILKKKKYISEQEIWNNGLHKSHYVDDNGEIQCKPHENTYSQTSWYKGSEHHRKYMKGEIDEY